MALKGSENPFPHALLMEQDDTVVPTPTTTGWHLFVDEADGLLKLKDDAGTVTPVGGAGGDITTDPAWAAKGDLIAGTANDAASILTAGANDTILMADSAQSTGLKWAASQTPTTQAYDDVAAQGTADTYARGDHLHGMPSAGGGGDLVLLGQATASASATLDFASLITSTYDRYLVTLHNLLNATNSQHLWLRFSTNNGSTYDTTAIYAYAHNGWSGSSGAATASTAQAQIILTYPANVQVNTTAAYGLSGHFYLVDPLSTSNYKQVEGAWTSYLGSARLASNFNAQYDSTTAVDAFRIMYASGNITSGTVRVYGIAK